ncbi:hypothetical protein EZV62_003294 [Acer yangbiense]|uniref:AAA+ ATPase domain-containing protein n=1 Tax=Acer yangbiense TaxID=1000413 RepID=A0A5C7IH51_9ROSI|nr:hypothetical protein EZV62_003294 [Acer yangbiense]
MAKLLHGPDIIIICSNDNTPTSLPSIQFSKLSQHADSKRIKEIRERLGGIEDDMSKFGFKETVIISIVVLRKLRSLHKQTVSWGWGGVDIIELKNLETILSSIRAVLLDAEKQQLGNNDVRGWLKGLKVACYDLEDALEDLENIKVLHDRQLKMDQSRSIARKVCDFISCSSKSFASLRFTIDSKQIKEIRERLEKGFEDRVHHLRDINGNVPKEREIITHSSFVVASDVFERDGDKENIIKALMQNWNFRFDLDDLLDLDNVDGIGNIIYISGPGGIGKTTVAKLVYNDKRIDETFGIKMWVCCSDKYFEKKIIIDMIYSVTGHIENTMEIDQLQQVLQDILTGKKYLLVLDEIDLFRDFPKLKTLLSVGAEESKIIAIESSNYANRGKTYQLNWLSNESCWSLFKRCAFKEGKEKNPRLIEIGKEIATKCAGHPLLVKILGSILYFSTDEDDWKYVRDKIKKLGVERETETERRRGKESISVLKLGYDLLPSHLKQCFVCCSVFPQDHGFNNIALIQFWMAHGLLQSDDKNEEPESIGMRYINELRWRCLFHDFEQNFDFISFKMHDLVHDLASEIAKNECFTMDSRRVYRHVSVVYGDAVPEQIFGNKMTRSIIFSETISPSQSLIGSCSSQHPKLRVLDFRNFDMEVLPESIGKLKHLRYLNLTQTIKIKRLPKSIFKLRNLETLLLGGCKELEELPRDIRHLVNLRMLVFSSKQRCLPENGIGCLTSLRCLGIGSCYNLEYLFQDIGRLQALQTLIIGDCPKLVSLPPGVKDLSSLEKLMLSDRKKSAKYNLTMENSDHQELQSIKLHLQMLCIDGLPEFRELPQWLLQRSANTLQWLAIKNCPKFETLPADQLRNLKSLEVLEISNCLKFSHLPDDRPGLTAMRELKVRNCPYFSVERYKWSIRRYKIDRIPMFELDGKSPVKSEMWFAVGGKRLRFSIQEFCLITGLECGPEPPVLSKEKGDGSGSFRSSMLNGEVRFNNKTLEAMFRAASSDNDEDMVKLALLYFLETVLFGKDQKVHIGAHHVELLEDLETFNKYPWGQKCYETTLNSLQRDLRRMSQEYHTTSREIVSGKKRKRQASKEKECIRQYPLHGFPYVFQIWACEAIPAVGVAIAIKSGCLLPRIVNWITPGTPDATYVMKLLDQKNTQVLQKLQPTPRESGEEYVKFLLSPECALEPPEIDGEGQEDMLASNESENVARERAEEKRPINVSTCHQQQSKHVCLVS